RKTISGWRSGKRDMPNLIDLKKNSKCCGIVAGAPHQLDESRAFNSSAMDLRVNKGKE
ncbi:hypothetical protein HAX54_016418, partial [Datura stramonium]|nr:hypothetical protein [Datura stramonium]